MSVEDRVKKIVSDQLGKSMDEIQSDSSFVDDLGADSLDTVDVLKRLPVTSGLTVIELFGLTDTVAVAKVVGTT